MLLSELFENKEKYWNMLKEDWNSVSDLFPEHIDRISYKTKQINEQYIQTKSAEFQKQIKSFPKIPLGRKKWKQKVFHLVKTSLHNENMLNVHQAMNSERIDQLTEEIKEFLRQERKFAPELSFADLGQAVRNYIVYTMFKEIHNDQSGFHAAAYAYSMLYPFTDNYIDHSNYTEKQKLEYNRIIYDKIHGFIVHPADLHQEKTCELLQTIISSYERNGSSCISQLLLMMLDAQECSIRQQNKAFPLSAEERLEISIYKGGISVLIDRYFVEKDITPEDLKFYLGFGFFLQLADDLQDIKEDSQLGHSTLFTLDLNSTWEEKTVNRLLNYINHIMKLYQPINNNFKNFVLSASRFLIYTSVFRSREYFSEEYLKQLEEYMPVTASYMENILNSRMEKQDDILQAQYMDILDGLIQ
jgi:hypothetical protein